MKTYVVTVAYHGIGEWVEVDVEAEDVWEACKKAIEPSPGWEVVKCSIEKPD